MARKSSTSQPPTRVLGADELSLAVTKLERRIAELRAFDVEQVQKEFDPKASALHDKIQATLSEIFGNGTVEFSLHQIDSLTSLSYSFGGSDYSLQQVRAGYRTGMDEAVTKLESVRDLLQERLLDLGGVAPVVDTRSASRQIGRRVFIVHGRDETAKQTLARFVEQLDLEAVILHEQPSKGRTIIEKLEAHLDVDFAIVLLTADDVGGLASNLAEQHPRARQNVIFELGLFIGSIGRSRVCALHTGSVELLSDYSGVAYVSMDAAGAWRLQVAREMRAAGLAVDMNRVVG